MNTNETMNSSMTTTTPLETSSITNGDATVTTAYYNNCKLNNSFS